MKNKTAVLAIVFALVLVFAGIGYSVLQKNYQPENPSSQPTSDNSTDAQKMVDFTVYDAAGNTVNLSDFADKPIVLNFWASWCGPCKAEMPDFQELYDEYGEKINFVFVNMTDGSRETKEIAEAFIADSGYTFDVYFDIDYNAAQNYAVRSMPQTYVINADGEIVYTKLGMISKQVLTQHLQDALVD